MCNIGLLFSQNRSKDKGDCHIDKNVRTLVLFQNLRPFPVKVLIFPSPVLAHACNVIDSIIDSIFVINRFVEAQGEMKKTLYSRMHGNQSYRKS